MSYKSQIEKLGLDVGAIVARHEQVANASDYTKYRDDPVGFMRDILRCDPWSMQEEAAALVRDHRRVLVISANGIGKDWLTARLALWWVYARGGSVIFTAPTERQVKLVLMREVRRAFTAAPELPGELYQLELRVSESSGIVAFTSDDADKLTGFHHPDLLICMTEGQGIEARVYEAALACATAPGNRIFVYGNPTKPTGPFYQAANSSAWKVLRIPASAHPNVVTGRQEIPGAISREWVELMKEEYGENSSIYRARVLAEFPEDAVEGLIKREWLRAAFARHESHELEPIAKTWNPIMGVDVARFGADKSALATVCGPIVRKLDVWAGASITESVQRVIDFGNAIACRLPIDHRPWAHIDSAGLGAGVYDGVKAKRWPAKEYNAAFAARDAERFVNLRAESFWALRTLLETNRIALPRDPLLEEEALAVEWQINQATGRVQMLGKDTMRAALGRSPDRLDAVVIGLYNTLGQSLSRSRTMQVGSFSIGM